VRLDVIRLIAKAFQADEIVHCLPHDAGNRHLGHHSEHDDLLTRAHKNAS